MTLESVVSSDEINIERKKSINIGLVVEINDGLIVPVIKNVDKMSFLLKN